VTERRVACFPANTALLARIRGAIGNASSIEAFTAVAPLVEAIRAGRINTTVVLVDAATFETQELVLRRIRASFASHPLIAYYNPRGLAPRNLLLLAQSGITDLVQQDVDDSKHIFGRILESAERTTHAQQLVDRLRHDIPAAAHSVFQFALEHAGRSMDVPRLSSALGTNRRTLAWRLKQNRLPPPREFLTWCRLLVAGLLLDERGRTLESVADQLNFPSGHTLGAVFFRYTGRGIVALREEGVSDAVIATFLKKPWLKGAFLAGDAA
jgi:AraC-like DNA-binding protein